MILCALIRRIFVFSPVNGLVIIWHLSAFALNSICTIISNPGKSLVLIVISLNFILTFLPIRAMI